jgi:hypothetical protein
VFSPAKSLAALAAVAVVSTSLGTGVASARRPVPQTGTKAPATHVKRLVNAAKPEAGSAGIPGFDDAKCQKLLNDVLSAYAEARNATARGDARKAWEAQGRGERTQAYLEDHCLVVY